MNFDSVEPGPFLFFSDLHIQNGDDPKYKALIKVLSDQRAKGLKGVFFLGDIFDLMVGPYDLWRKLYAEFFTVLHDFDKQNIFVVWIQGNHDFFIESLAHDYSKRIQVVDTEYVFLTQVCGQQKKFYLSHGDLVNAEDNKYQRWRKFTRHPLFHSFLSLWPESLAERVLLPWAQKSSAKSRRSYVQTASEEIFLRKLYRNAAIEKWNAGFDGVFMGHCHLFDDFKNKSTQKFYLNLGSVFDLPKGNVMRYGIWDSRVSAFPNTKLYSTIE
jgi:UDP-2,3-diacylglucosamine hydrolase